jgi:hypothetical protein
MAADVSYPDVVRYVLSHCLMMTTRIIPVSPQQRRGKHHQRQKRVMTVPEWTPILMCHLEVVALFACLSTSYKLISSNRTSHPLAYDIPQTTCNFSVFNQHASLIASEDNNC